MTSEFHPFNQLFASAQAGDADCFKAVAVCYATGYGVEIDEEQALYWYKKAWKFQHHSEIAIAIAHLYFNQNSTRNAVYWLEKAVDLGNASAALEYVRHLMTRKKLKSDILLWQLLTKVMSRTDISEVQRKYTLEMIKQLSEM